jgi:hypothetical protein
MSPGGSVISIGIEDSFLSIPALYQGLLSSSGFRTLIRVLPYNIPVSAAIFSYPRTGDGRTGEAIELRALLLQRASNGSKEEYWDTGPGLDCLGKIIERLWLGALAKQRCANDAVTCLLWRSCVEMKAAHGSAVQGYCGCVWPCQRQGACDSHARAMLRRRLDSLGTIILERSANPRLCEYRNVRSHFYLYREALSEAI